MITNVDPDSIAGFVREVQGYLPKLGRSLEEYRNHPDKSEWLEEAHRMIHSIRGAGSTLGLIALSRMAQYSEETLEQVLDGSLTWSDDLASVLESATVKIADYLHGFASGSLREREIATDVVISFRRLRNLPESGDADEIERLIAGSASVADQPGSIGQDEGLPADSQMQTLDEFSVDSDLWNAFQEEAAEHFKTLAEGLPVLETGADQNTLKAVRRAVHQLKGASGVLGMMKTSRLCAGMQKVLDRIFENEMHWSVDLLPLFTRTFEVVLESVGGHGTGMELNDRGEALLAEFDTLLAVPAHAPPKSEASAPGAIEDRVDVGDDLWDAFNQEAEEHLNTVSELLRQTGQNVPEMVTLQAMRRSVHTLKGACGVVGLRLTAAVAHRMEDLLDVVSEGRAKYTVEMTPLLFATFDVLTDAVSSRGLGQKSMARVADLFTRYEAVLNTAPENASAEPEPADEAAEAPAEHSVSRKQAQFVRAPLERVDELVRLVSELVIHRSRFEQHLSAYVREVSDLQMSIERLTRISRRLQSDYEAAALQEANRKLQFAAAPSARWGTSSAEDFDALEFDRYTEFHLLSRDLAETTGDVTNGGSRLNDLISDFDSYLNRLSTLTGEVEDRLMRLRMLPLKHVSARLHRTVRVTGERRGKLVDLVVEGETVELDKTVLEEMAGPLEHLLRNAVDHGVEPPATRRASDKPERGTIVLRAFHEGTQVVLQIRDDGRGIDPERVRESAVRNGFVSQEESRHLSDPELFGFLFLQGFSTAKEVSEVSGRGVGLDVVKSAVSKMKGTISVNSERNKGTTFTIRLPMTLALTRVVLVKSGSETYAIPVASISSILRIEPDQLERVGRKPVLRLGNRVVPTMYLAEVTGQRQPQDANLTKLKAVVLNIGDQSLALMVDQVLEAREVVVKTLSGLLGRVHGVTGATLMGDGAVVLILNPNDMLHQQHTLAPQVRLRTPGAPKQSKTALDVLIVDDSPSVRRVLANLIKNAGWNPHMAKDGLEALEMIHASAVRPDVVLLDIEMPRMDGYELASALRNMVAHRATPIIMLTSRAGEKHRKRAFEVGATDYMVKPYQDDELLNTVRRVTQPARAMVQ